MAPSIEKILIFGPKQLKFTRNVVGLGNKQYKHYNNMDKFMDAALEKCGASRITPIGLGDDNDDLEGDFETWKDTILWPALTKKYIQGKGAADALSAAAKKKEEEGLNALPCCPYHVKNLEEKERGNVEKVTSEMIHTSSKHYFYAVDCPVVVKRELHNFISSVVPHHHW